MTDRFTTLFNFYDLYAYLIPGALLLFLLLAPIQQPPGSLGIILGAVVAYTLGFILHDRMRAVVPSTLPSGRYPSDTMMDPDPDPMKDDATIRQRYADAVRRRFGIDPTPSSPKTRNTAFKLARSTLFQSGVVSHAHQFQGLQGMCRGLVGVAMLARVYYTLLAATLLHPLIGGLVLIGSVALAWKLRSADSPPDEVKHLLWPVTLAAAGGFMVGRYQDWSIHMLMLSVAVVLLSHFSIPIARRLHDSHAKRFVEEIMLGLATLSDSASLRAEVTMNSTPSSAEE